MGNILYAIKNFIFGSSDGPAKTKIGILGKIKHIAVNHFRGILGFIIGCLFAPTIDNTDPDIHLKQTRDIWLMMIAYYILQPVSPALSSVLPIILVPIYGIVDSKAVCTSNFTDSVALFIIGGWALLMLNNSGTDKRVIIRILTKSTKKVTPMKLVISSSIAAYLMSMVSNKLFVTGSMVEIISKPLMDSKSGVKGKEDVNVTIKCILSHAVATASSLGSLGVLHASMPVLVFRAAFYGDNKSFEYPDIFNYIQYSLFALPISFICLLFSVGYYCGLMRRITKKNPLSEATMNSIVQSYNAEKTKLGKFTAHDWQCLFFTTLFIVLALARWVRFSPPGTGWASVNLINGTEVPGVRDATVAAIIVTIVSMLPKDLSFLKILKAKKKSELPPPKACSAILYWRFIDTNVMYAYIFVCGAGVVLDNSFKKSGFGAAIGRDLHDIVTSLGPELFLLVTVIITAIAANITNGMAAIVIIMPVIKAIGSDKTNEPWYLNSYIPSLGVGIAGSFGFVSSFRYTTNFYVRTVGNCNYLTILIYGLVPLVLCSIILWIALMYYAKIIFDPSELGIELLNLVNTTASAAVPP